MLFTVYRILKDRNRRKRLIQERKNNDSPQGSAHPRVMKYRSSRTARSAATLISLLLVLGALTPATARASVLGDFVSSILLHVPEKQKAVSSGSGNIQTMVL